MSIKKLSLLTILLVFLSGSFTLNRLNLGFTFEVKYLLFLGFVFLALFEISNIKSRKEKRLNSTTLFFLIVTFTYVFLSTISVFYAKSQILAFEKLISLFFLLALTISILYIVKEMRPGIFLNYVTGFFVILGIVYAIPVVFSVLSGASRGDVNLSGPNVATRILFFAYCSSLYRYNLYKKIPYLLLGIGFLASIVLIGSRGGLVAAIVTLALLFAIKRVFVPWNIKKIIKITYKQLLLFPLCLGAIILVYEPVKRVFMGRVIGTTFANETVYTSGRDVLYAEAISMIKERPIFGNGLASFTASTGSVYPHNLLLEMILEVGLIGLVFFLIFLMFSISFIFKMKKTPLFILSGIPLYMIIAQMFSGEFYDFRYYFLWSVVLSFYGVLNKSEVYLENEKVNIKEYKIRKWKRYVWNK